MPPGGMQTRRSDQHDQQARDVTGEHEHFTLVVFQQGGNSAKPRRSFSFEICGNATVEQFACSIAAALDVPQYQVQLCIDDAPVASTSWASQLRASRRRIDLRLQFNAPGPYSREYSPFIASLPALLAEDCGDGNVMIYYAQPNESCFPCRAPAVSVLGAAMTLLGCGIQFAIMQRTHHGFWKIVSEQEIYFSRTHSARFPFANFSLPIAYFPHLKLSLSVSILSLMLLCGTELLHRRSACQKCILFEWRRRSSSVVPGHA